MLGRETAAPRTANDNESTNFKAPFERTTHRWIYSEGLMPTMGDTTKSRVQWSSALSGIGFGGIWRVPVQ